MPDTAHSTSPASPHEHPSAALLHYSILLTGFGTVFLGPLLPTLTASLHTTDRGGGSLLAAQFIGSFLGGWTTHSPLNRSMARGYVAAIAGFALLGWCLHHAPALRWFLPALFVLGFGVGQLITSVNLMASQKWVHRRGAALTLLNFSWSLGALTAPLLVLRLLQVVSAGTVLQCMALLLLAGFLAALLTGTIFRKENTAPGGPTDLAAARADVPGLPLSAFVYYASLLFLYGGVETSMSGWLTTYDARYGSGLYHHVALSTTVFWTCLTTARALATAALLRVREVVLLRGGLAVAVVSLTGLLLSHSAASIALCAGLLGIALSPWFPLVFSQMAGESPRASQAGKVIAVSGLGAAALPWLVGQTSAATGSLRIGLVLPIVGVAALLLLSLARKPVTSQL